MESIERIVKEQSFRLYTVDVHVPEVLTHYRYSLLAAYRYQTLHLSEDIGI